MHGRAIREDKRRPTHFGRLLYELGVALILGEITAGKGVQGAPLEHFSGAADG
jgi:hypothetical protein